MNSQLIPFSFENKFKVRTILIDSEPWFIARDTGTVLDISDVKSTLRSFPESEKGVHTMHTPGGDQQMLIVNEPGLYRLIFQSRKPEAERFKTWVFTEVLPQIRKTGSYGVNAGELKALRESLMLAKSERDTYKRLWLEERKTVLRFEKRAFLTWEDKREILTLLINNYPLSKIQRITKKSYDRIKSFRDELIAMNDEELERFHTRIKAVGREAAQGHEGGAV